VQWTTRNGVAGACRHQKLAAVVWIGGVGGKGGKGRGAVEKFTEIF